VISSTYDDALQVVFRTLLAISVVAVVTGLAIMLLPRLEKWFLRLTWARFLIGVTLVSLWVLFALIALLAALESVGCLLGGQAPRALEVLLVFFCVLTPCECALICWHVLLSTYRKQADVTTSLR